MVRKIKYKHIMGNLTLDGYGETKMEKEKKIWKVKELIESKDIDKDGRIKDIRGEFTIVNVGECYQNRKKEDPRGELWSRKFSVVDSDSESTKPFLTLTLFDNIEKGIFSEFDLGDKFIVDYAMYERKEWNEKVYHNLTIGKFGKIEKVKVENIKP